MLGLLDETRLFLGQFGTLFPRFTLPGPRKTLIIVGHAPLYLIPFSSFFWFTVPGIFSFHYFIITPFILYRCYTQASFVRTHTHTLRLHMMCTPFLVHTYAFAYDVHDIFSIHLCRTDIEWYVCSFFPLFSNFSIVCHTHLRSIAALQLLEFHWNTTYIGTMLPGWWTYPRIFITSHLDPWKLSLGW